MQPAPLLALEGLQLSFPGMAQPAVAGVSLQVAAGETLALVGESGSGKSLTALSLLGLTPASAEVRFKRLSFFPPQQPPLTLLDTQPFPTQLRGQFLSMIFQDPHSSLNPIFTIGEQLRETLQWRWRYGRQKARHHALEWLEKVGLVEPLNFYQRYPHQLSGGQKQRAMIAMALCTRPALLLADEPTTALDTTVQRHILDLLQCLQQELGIGILFISHDLVLLRHFADRVMVLQAGLVIEEGRVEAVFAQPQQAYTRNLLACRPQWAEVRSRLPTLQSEPAPALTQVTKVAGDQPSTNLLEVSGLTVRFPRQVSFWGGTHDYVTAVDAVDLVIPTGQTLGVVGESGSGKTTLGRSLLRLVEPQQGRIAFAGVDLLTLSASALRSYRRRLQMIFQDPFASLNPRLPIGWALVEPMEVHHIQPNRSSRVEYAVHLLEMVGLSADHFERLPHEFSGGQRQRIGIARALAVQPQFLVCDECVSALDVSVQAQVLNLLKDLQQQLGLTYLFISHDLAVVNFMSDALLVMHAGRIVERGTPQAVYQNPQHPFTQALLAASF